MEATTFRCPSCGAAVGRDEMQCSYCKSQLATVACPRCFGLVAHDARRCSHCGAAIQTCKEAPSKLGCPECKLQLASTTVGEVQLEQCHQCGGLWIHKELFDQVAADRQERGDVLSALPGDTAKAAPLRDKVFRYRCCPQCTVMMNRANFAQVSGIVVDVCKPHGIWFDRNELRQVLEFIEAGGLDKSRQRQLRELEEKQRQASRTSSLPLGAWEPDPRFTPGVVVLMDAASNLIRWLK